ncbi:MAG TPA: hypothetical protein VLF90_01595 [Patescibacteria group bacterium]|nr:hypothetical protein [Patescibacteria group bacterium]
MKKFIPWFAAYLIITIIFGTIYTSVQQSLRLSANDPQIQLAEDTAAQLNVGTAPTQLVTSRVDMAASLAPFVIIYDKAGRVVTGSGMLDGKVPTISYGVLQHATSEHNNSVTWQPRSDVRIATVVAAANQYYVASGRNLREVEKRENIIVQLNGIGWFLSIGVLVALYMYKSKTASKK